MNFIDMNDDELERYMDLMIDSLEEALEAYTPEPEVQLVHDTPTIE